MELSESGRCTPAPADGAVQRIVRNSTLNLIGQGFLAVFYLVVVFILARTLGKEGLGAYYTFFALILAVQWVGEAGISTVLTCRIAQQPQNWATIVAEAAGLFTVITLLSAGVFWLVGSAVAWYQHNADLWFWSAAAGVACGAIQVNRFCGGVLRAFERVGYENFARFVQGAIFVLLVVVVVLAGRGTVGMVLAMFAASHVVASTFLLIRLSRQYRLGWRLNLAVARNWLAEAVPLGFGDVVRHLTWQLDTLLLGLLRPPAVVGIYSVAYRPLGPLNWLPQAVLSAMFPAVARMADGDRAALSRTFTHSMRLMWVASLPLAVTICLCAEPLILILAGRDYLEAAVPMRVLIWIAILSFLSFPFRFLFTAVGKQKLFAWLVVGVFLLEAVIELSLIPAFGYLGACTGSVIGELIFTVTGLSLCARLGIGTLPARPMASAVVAAVVMAGVLWPVTASSWIVLGLVVVVAGLIYLAICIGLGALQWSEVVCFRDSLLGLLHQASRRQQPDELAQTVFHERTTIREIDRPTPAGPGDHVQLIREARDWMQQLSREEIAPPPYLTVGDLEAVLHEPVRTCTLWRVNWRNRVYRVELAHGRSLVAKQILVPVAEQARLEYEQLKRLESLPVPGLHVPRPLVLLAEQRAYLMELVPGTTLQGLYRDSSRCQELPNACAQAGRVLGRLHQQWTERVTPLALHDLADDLALLPGGFTANEWQTIHDALDLLGTQEIALGHLYLDFKVDNLLFDRSSLTLIDPPHQLRRGILLWDYATFRSSLCWQWWQVLARRPGTGNSQILESSLAAFDEAYGLTYAVPRQLAVSPLLFRLLELQHVGQRLVFQLGKLNFARRWRSPLQLGGHFYREVLATCAWLPALQLRKRCLLRQLQRLLQEECRCGLENQGTSSLTAQSVAIGPVVRF